MLQNLVARNTSLSIFSTRSLCLSGWARSGMIATPEFWNGFLWLRRRTAKRSSLGGGVVESTATEFAAAWSGPFSVEGGGGPFSVEGSGGGATRLVTFVGGGIFQRKTDKILQGQIN